MSKVKNKTFQQGLSQVGIATQSVFAINGRGQLERLQVKFELAENLRPPSKVPLADSQGLLSGLPKVAEAPPTYRRRRVHGSEHSKRTSLREVERDEIQAVGNERSGLTGERP